MKNLQERIAHARKTLHTPPHKAYEISGYWEKGNKDDSSWVGMISSLDADNRPSCDFNVQLLHRIKWMGKKEDGPKGKKTWLLADGLYKASLVEKKGAERIWCFFAVIDGKREELSEEQVILILQSEIPSPEDSLRPAEEAA